LYGCRLDPAKYAGLSEGDAHVIRNAGGRASDDAIRSLIISYKLLGTAEWFVIHHTDCGMETLQMILSEIYYLLAFLQRQSMQMDGEILLKKVGLMKLTTFRS
jgi:hypothetical protein